MESVPGRHRQEQRKRGKGRKYHYIWKRGMNFESRWGKEWVGKLEASGNRQICIRLKVTSTHVCKIITLFFPNDFNFIPCINYSSFPSEPPAEYKIYALFSNPFWLNVIFMRWWPTWVIPPSILSCMITFSLHDNPVERAILQLPIEMKKPPPRAQVATPAFLRPSPVSWDSEFPSLILLNEDYLWRLLWEKFAKLPAQILFNLLITDALNHWPVPPSLSLVKFAFDFFSLS